MREIKFRAWDKLEKFMHTTAKLLWEDGQLYWGYTEAMPWQQPSDYVLMQYTGLKDKNGVEIYEGDIMNVRGGMGAVEYDDNNVCFVVNVDIDYNPCIGRYEVIGNIYSNPELLEVSHDS